MQIKNETAASATIYWPPLISGTLIRRYKRFLADVRLDNGKIVTAHCPNSGRMTECCEPGRTVYVSRSDRPGRKLKYTWELIAMADSLVGVNTQVPNRLVHDSISAGRIPQLNGYADIRREVKVGANSRIDIVLESSPGNKCFIEVKNCTLVSSRVACFPDAVTARGKKHLEELQKLVQAGFRAVMFFLIQRMDAQSFRPADHIDPAYGDALRQAVNGGVEIMAYDVHMDLTGISIRHELPCLIDRFDISLQPV